jgi:large subunit ribosomal protein L18e
LRSGAQNYQVKQLLVELQSLSLNCPFWKRILKDVSKPSRQRRTVNVYKINKFAKEGEMIIVPGKVLSVGDISKKVDVAAMNFSNEAKEKITKAQGRVLSISELLKENPEGKKVRILG